MTEDTAGLLALALGLFVIAGTVHSVRNTARDGGLARNAFLGLRTSATLASDRAWSEGHLAAVPRLTAAMRCGYATGAVALGFLLSALAAEALLPLAWAAAVLGYAASMALLVAATVRSHTVAKRVLEETR
ncbi:SdpI family protein [Nocardiopsis sp. CNT312]|uniref:SdpI family protein n=1 Tax=Nocardiopsis sp. CNT312 TaxID=1137268 RepID=UPI0004BB4A87|nr:SdpI family protein [Nocardiopsis sp. CNT312]